MDKALIDFRLHLLRQRFAEDDANRVLEWLIASEGRRPVVLVGAGFTRNARHRQRRYVRDEEAPLWLDIAKRMAERLRIDTATYDTPTMAEMYKSSFEFGTLRDMLCGMLPDEQLRPGRAHKALAEYDAEAIITTNMLDTVLDRLAPKRATLRTIVVDADLSRITAGSNRQCDLIYFHGHRSHPESWILTRSQYETVGRSRPVLVARVRQLLAQHPLLVLGFGLADPNFHNIYRQLSEDMSRCHPIGLAIHLGAVTTAERRHWSDLGVRIAVPRSRQLVRDPKKANAFFVWLFAQIATSWAPARADTMRYVMAPHTVAERLERFGDLLRYKWKPE